MNTQTESKPAQLLDIHEITQVLYAYCHGVDHSDKETLRACFHPDATHEHGEYKGKSHDFIPFIIEFNRERSGQTHAVTNCIIRVDGDRAFSDCQFSAYSRTAAKDGKISELFVKGRFLDRFERRNGAWKISRRLGIHDRESMVDAPEAQGNIMGGLRSGPKPNDPYYQMLDEFLNGK
jgi:SnoaL-like domain